MSNPHFDHNRVIWQDEYSGKYQPIDYGVQFDPEWKLFLEKRQGFYRHTGVETEDEWINDRIFDLTGVEDYLHLRTGESSVDRTIGGRQMLDLKFAPGFFKGKRCLDAACGAGRWTKTLIKLGARVKSIDVSEHGLQSVRQFNDDVERLDLFEIPQRTDLRQAFDFTICWGVVHHTHDPKQAFANVAQTVKPGGGLYVMIYAPNYHNSVDILKHRRHYHQNLKTFEEKLAYAETIADRRENAHNYLDMLNTFYNWVVEETTIHNWFRVNGFIDVITLNASETYPVAYHVFGRKRTFHPPLYNDLGQVVPRLAKYNRRQAVQLKRPFEKEQGHAWYAPFTNFADRADSTEFPERSTLVLLENGKPLWARHAQHLDVRNLGCGRYSHWNGILLFSTSDNSDPNTNKRKYEYVFAESA